MQFAYGKNRPIRQNPPDRPGGFLLCDLDRRPASLGGVECPESWQVQVMEDSVLVALKKARLDAWVRMQELVGEMAHQWMESKDEEEEDASPATERLETLKELAFELLSTLIPNCGWIRYGVYDPEDAGTGFVIVRICHNDVEFSRNECTTVPIIRPVVESPAPESSAIDLLKALGE